MTYLSFNLLFISCRKENTTEGIIPQDEILSQSSNPGVINGMLHFDSYSDFEYFISDLQQQESDTSAVRNAYINFGIDLSEEELPNFTDHPVCLEKELAISGFSSARKQEEQVINAALDSGSDMFSIISDPYFKTALNQYYAVHIGSRIFKFFDNGAIAMILNEDWDLYNTIKSSSLESLSINPNLIIISRSRSDWSDYYLLGSDKSVISEISLYQPYFTSATVNGQVNIFNDSRVESDQDSQTYKWLYSDNTTSFGRDPNRTFATTDSFKVVIDNGKGIKDTFNQEEILRCWIGEKHIEITNLVNGQIRFRYPHRFQADYTLKWTFGDGTTSTQLSPIKSFTSSGIVLLQILRADGSERCAGTKPYTVTCGEQKTVNQRLERTINNQTWRIDASIWVRPGSAGCSMKYLRNTWIGWRPWSNLGVCTEITGNYNRRQDNGTCISVFVSEDKCLGKALIQHQFPLNS